MSRSDIFICAIQQFCGKKIKKRKKLNVTEFDE